MAEEPVVEESPVKDGEKEAVSDKELARELEKSYSGMTVEDIAKEFGWKPERGEGDDPKKRWLDAVSFMRKEKKYAKKLQRNYSSLKEEMVNLRQDVHELREALESGYGNSKETLQSLQKQWATAVEEGEVKLASELQDKIFDLKTRELQKGDKKADPKEREKLRAQRILEEWKEDNPWYEEDAARAKYADKVFAKYQKPDNTLLEPLEDVLEEVERQVYLHFDANPKGGEAAREKSKVADVGGGAGTRNVRTEKLTFDRLTPAQKEICDKMVKARTLKNRQEYCDSLAEAQSQMRGITR